MKKKDIKRRLNETQSELHESIWCQAQERDKRKVAEAAMESYQEELTEVMQENADQLLMLENQAADIVKLMKEVKGKSDDK